MEFSPATGVQPAAGILALSAMMLAASAAAISLDMPALIPAVGGAMAALWIIKNTRSDQGRSGVSSPHAHDLSRGEMNGQPDGKTGSAESRLGALFDTLGDMFVLHTTDGQILEANQTFRTATGIDEPCGMSLAQTGVIPQEIENRLEVQLGEGETARTWTWHPSGEHDEGHGLFLIRAIGRGASIDHKADVALDEARIRAEAANTAKTRFLATVSHEIRTPLNGILGMTHLLTQTEVTREQASYLKSVRESGFSLLALIEDLLDTTSIEAGRFHLRQNEFDPHELVQAACELMAPHAHEKNIEIASTIAPDVPRKAICDAGRLKQVLLNLIGNAIKFTTEGGILLSVSCTPETLDFQVRDSGPGLKPEDQRRIFEEFERADNSSTRRHGGAGLGLSISARIVEALGGKIGVRSEIGAGSRFHFSVPLVHGETEIFGDEPAVEQSSPLAGKAVLILAPEGPVAEALIATIVGFGGIAAHAKDNASLPEAIARIRHDSGQISDLMIDRRIGADDITLVETAAALIGNSVDRTLIIAQEDSRDLAISPDLAAGKWLVRPVRNGSLISVLTARDDRADRSRASAPIPAPALLRPSDAPTFDILLAEDNPVNALVVRTMLAREGHRVTLVENGIGLVDEALERPEGLCRFDLAITDLSMPDLDGISAIQKIRQCEAAENLARMPIVVLSADGQAETRDNILAAGADGHAEKPIDPVWLNSLVSMAGGAGRKARD